MAARSPTCSTASPAAAKSSGNNPHAIPSFRLLTNPAWLVEKSARSLQLTSEKTCPKEGCGVAPVLRSCFASARACPRESRTNKHGQQQPRHGEDDAEVEGLRAQRVGCRQVAGGERRQRDRDITPEFVEAHGHAAPSWPDQVDLHDHRRGPAQPLV